MFDRKPGTRAEQRSSRPPADLVSELLLGMRLNGLHYRRIQMALPFGVGFGTVEGRAQFHFVARGPIFLRIAGAVHRLDTHDAVLLPRGGVHDLLSAPDLPSRDIVTYEATQLCDTVGAITSCTGEACRTNDAL